MVSNHTAFWREVFVYFHSLISIQLATAELPSAINLNPTQWCNQALFAASTQTRDLFPIEKAIKKVIIDYVSKGLGLC